jgi:hypothetical protein
MAYFEKFFLVRYSGNERAALPFPEGQALRVELGESNHAVLSPRYLVSNSILTLSMPIES